MHAYERWTVRRYVANALKTSRFAKPPRPGSDIVAWLDEHAASVGLAPRVRRQGSRRNAWDEDPPYVEDWATWRRESFVLASGGAPGASPLQKRIDWLSYACGLTEEQSEALGLLARLTLSPMVMALVEAVNGRHGLDLGVVDASDLRALLGSHGARRACSDDGGLAELGLIAAPSAPRLSHVARSILSLPRLGARNVARLLLGEPAAATQMGRFRTPRRAARLGRSDRRRISQAASPGSVWAQPALLRTARRRQDGIRQDAWGSSRLLRPVHGRGQ